MGELKPGWRWVKFAQLAECANDRVDDPSTSGVDRYVGLDHLDPESLIIRRWGAPHEVESTKLRFKPGDIIFGKRRAYQRKLAVADFEGICSAHAMVLRAKPSAVLPEFLPFFMQSDTFMERAVAISVGSLSPTINWKTLAAEEFVLPPLEEQRRLAALLATATAAARTAHDAADRAEVARRSLLFSWFRPRRGGQDHFPRHWQTSSMGAMGETQIGIRKHPGSLAGPNMRPYLRVANVLDGRIDTREVLEINIPPADLQRCALRESDILVNKGNSMDLVGRAALFQSTDGKECYFQDHLMRYRVRPGLLPVYAHAYLQHLLYTLQFTRIAVASTSIATIPADLFERLPLPLPPLAEQAVMVEEMVSIVGAIPALRERARVATQMGRAELAAGRGGSEV